MRDFRTEMPDHFLPERVETVRWRLVSAGGFPAKYAVLATDRLRQSIVHGLRDSDDPEDFLLGGHRASDETRRHWGSHSHAHWLWTASQRKVRDLVLWVPAGLNTRQLRHVLTITRLPRWPREPGGYCGGELCLQQVGPGHIVLADLGHSMLADEWTSATPMLTTWHCKPRQDWGEVMAMYVMKELQHRFGDDAPRLLDLEVTEEKGYFTRRWDDSMRVHQAFWVDLMRFDRPIPGVLCLGALSHFGFGRLMPL